MCVKVCLNAFHAPSLSPSVIRTVFLPDSGLVSLAPMRNGNLRQICLHLPLFLVSEQSGLEVYVHVHMCVCVLLCSYGSLAGLAESGQHISESALFHDVRYQQSGAQHDNKGAMDSMEMVNYLRTVEWSSKRER